MIEKIYILTDARYYQKLQTTQPKLERTNPVSKNVIGNILCGARYNKRAQIPLYKKGYLI